MFTKKYLQKYNIYCDCCHSSVIRRLTIFPLNCHLATEKFVARLKNEKKQKLCEKTEQNNIEIPDQEYEISVICLMTSS